MNNFLMWTAGILVVALCALFAVPPLVDWNQYRGIFEEEVSRLLGREVRVGGEVRLRILPVPYVSFEQVRIADAPGVPGSFFRTDKFNVLLSVPPLLRGIIEARKLELDGPKLRLRFDKQGSWNWQRVKMQPSYLPLLPKDIALQSAVVSNGSIRIEDANGLALAQIDEISGELTATALRGPYKYTGSALIAGVKRKIRLATSSIDSGGSLRLKTSAQSSIDDSSMTIDGRIIDFAKKPKFAGALKANSTLKLGLFGSEIRAAPLRLTGELSADTLSANLSNVAISIESLDRPQRLAGQLTTRWGSQASIEGTLTSKWLDFDAITNGRSKDNPALVLGLLTSTGFGMGQFRASQLSVDIEQANLGGQTVSALQLDFAQQGKGVKINRLSIGLPGRTQLRADGSLQLGQSKPVISGYVLVKGASLSEFTAWARPGRTSLGNRASGVFNLASRIDLGDDALHLNISDVSIAGQSSRGNISYSWGAERPQANIDIWSDHLDISHFARGSLSLKNAAAALGWPLSDAPATAPLADLLGKADLTVSARVGSANDGQNTLSDMQIRLTKREGLLRVEPSRFTIGPGLKVALEGEVHSQSKVPLWDIVGRVEMADDVDVEQLSHFASQVVGIGPPQLTAITRGNPTKLAFSTKSEIRAGKPRTSLKVDGAIASDKVRASLTTAGPLTKWRQQHLDADATVDGDAGSSVGILLAALSGSTADPLRQKRGVEPVKTPPKDRSILRLSVAGTPDQQLEASATIASQEWQIRLEGKGQSSVRQTGKFGLDWDAFGDIRISDVATAMRTISPDWPTVFAPTIASSGRFAIARTSDRLILEPIDLQVGETKLSGSVQVDLKKRNGSRHRVSGRLWASAIHGPTLAHPLNVASSRPSEQLATNPSGSFWSEQPFVMIATELFDVDMQIATPEFSLVEGVDLANANLSLQLSDGKITLSKVTGTMFGGRFSAGGQLRPARAGVIAEGKASLTSAHIEAIVSPNMRQRVGGSFAASISFQGQGLSPRALVTALKGKGQLSLKEARLPGLPGASLSRLADDVVVGAVKPDQMSDIIKAQVLEGSIAIPDQSSLLELRDGALKIDDVTVDQGRTILRNSTAVDLVRMVLNSRWRVASTLLSAETASASAREANAAQQRLPSVRLDYSGPVANLSSIEPEVDSADLQRELTVRRMEHDVQRLESLRREDEALGKAEAKRRRRSDTRRRRAIEEDARKRRLYRSKYKDSRYRRVPLRPDPSRLEEEDLPPPTDGESQQIGGEDWPGLAPQTNGIARSRPYGSTQRPGGDRDIETDDWRPFISN
ncbi:MAG: AsmA family protein [Hyphomicrobiaceae bacterium]